MKILEKYILAEFVKLLAISVAAFIMLFMMVDLFENMNNLIKHRVPLGAGVMFFLYKVPFIVSQTVPVATLLSALLSLGILAKHNEITAMKAAGVKLMRAAAPLLACGLAISVAVIAMNEYVTPLAMKKTDSFRRQWFGGLSGSFGKGGLWIRTPDGILNVRQIDFKNKVINGVTYYVVAKPFRVSSRIETQKAEWRGGRWVAGNASVWSFSERGEAVRRAEADVTLQGLFEPSDLVNAENMQKNMGFIDLYKYIKGIEADGYESARYRIELWGKLAFPLVSFIMVLVGIPFGLKTGRHAGIATGVGISVVIAFSYWVVFATMRSLGQSGVLPPLVSAFFPDLLFLAVGSLMFGFVRQ